jgi:diguanylate cyclase (GGDEF)-like protein
MNGFIKKELEDYIVTVDRLCIEGKLFWVVGIESEENFLIYKDFTTGLYNRNYWEDIKNGIQKFSGVVSYSIILIDIDNLKEKNDTYGHLEGDKAIKIVGKAIQNAIRENDIAIHYGGDEFL